MIGRHSHRSHRLRHLSLLALAAAAAGCSSGAPVVVARPVPSTPAAPVQATAADTIRARSGVDITKPPMLAGAPTLHLPPLVTRELPNGMRLMVVEQHELPVADFVLLVKSGYEADPASRPGLAGLTADMLDEGTTSRSTLQIADQQAYLGAQLASFANWDYSAVRLHVPTAQLDSALALFADVALHPAFAPTELERLRKQRLTALLQYKDQPRQIASVVFGNVLYGNEHPYGHPTMGTEAAMRAVTRDDVRRFYDSHYLPNNATLIVVGDVQADDVARRVTALFGEWRRGAVPVVEYPTLAPRAPTTVYLVDKPGAAQSSVRIGSIGVARSTPDYFALQVMNTILGGSFSSRLNQNLRETHGYTYGAGSGFSMRQQAGPFTASAEIVSAKTDSALLEFMKELRDIRDTVPQTELARAKRYIQLQLPADFETTTGIAFQLIPIAVYDLPTNYYDTYVQQIENVTQADVQRVASRYLDPAHLAIVVVGDRHSVGPKIQALNLGNFMLRGIWGEPVQP